MTTRTSFRFTGRLLVVGVLLLWLVVQVYPIVFLFFTSLKTDPQILSTPFALPFPPQLSNYAAVIEGGRTNQSILVYFFNSVVVTVGTLVLLLAVSSLAGYALARGRFPGSAATQQLFLLALAVPVHVLLIPIYFFFGELGLRNNLLGLILLYTTLGLPFTTILMRSYFVSFPRELEEAARIDGCSRFGTFWRVVLPVSRGALASMAIINVGWVWSELFFGLVLLDKLGVRTLPLAIAAYKPSSMAQQTSVGELFAIMSLTVLPMIVFYFVFQKQIRKGMTAGAVK
ncbi:MAG TPA: carbohydrate ABC transporter permease [Devosia sp.]|jgi:ABC-type glycerol-3-phosphate transport system permease component|uniref:carbohydrate ABC transporter permease n=1 Tax=Devosia sp. TaxID=1871048 RepID=UPI002DDCED87|nr:carbohydrate ABC transporter permease [Devosia sp.]HEV2514253.1 carbohydrate ABC transporter permease [Devosia sp.]